MTHRLNPLRSRSAALAAGLLLLLVAAGCVGEAASSTARPLRVLVVADAAAIRDPALMARTTAAMRRAERGGTVQVQLRVPRTPTEQLSVTHYFAAKGYDAVIGAGLDRRVAVDPVARRFPAMRFALVAGDGLPAALSRAARAR